MSCAKSRIAGNSGIPAHVQQILDAEHAVEPRQQKRRARVERRIRRTRLGHAQEPTRVADQPPVDAFERRQMRNAALGRHAANLIEPLFGERKRGHSIAVLERAFALGEQRAPRCRPATRPRNWRRALY